MEAALMHLILDVASSGLPHIAQHLSEYVFERVVAYLPAMLSRGLHGAITVVAHVEGGAIEVTAVLGGVTIMSAQALHILLSAQHTRHDDLVKGNAFDLQTVEERLPDVLQQHGGTWHKIGYAVMKLIYVEIGIAPDIHQFRLTVFGILTVGNRCYPQLPGRHILHILLVGEGLGISGDAIDQAVAERAVSIKKSGRRQLSGLYRLVKLGFYGLGGRCVGTGSGLGLFFLRPFRLRV